eukprot:2912995-Pyramimonas_sp.AAC.1
MTRRPFGPGVEFFSNPAPRDHCQYKGTQSQCLIFERPSASREYSESIGGMVGLPKPLFWLMR